MKHFKIENWRIRFLMSRTDHCLRLQFYCKVEVFDWDQTMYKHADLIVCTLTQETLCSPYAKKRMKISWKNSLIRIFRIRTTMWWTCYRSKDDHNWWQARKVAASGSAGLIPSPELQVKCFNYFFYCLNQNFVCFCKKNTQK